MGVADVGDGNDDYNDLGDSYNGRIDIIMSNVTMVGVEREMMT